MRKTSDGIVYILLSVLMLIIVSIACNLPRNDQSNLTLNPRAEDGSVSGSYSTGGTSDKISFNVTTKGFAVFHLEGAPQSKALIVNLSDEQSAKMDWNGITLDGYGALTAEEQSALENLMNNDIALGLEMIPLDIGCQGDDKIDPQQVAALLVPLQMRFKYLVTERGTVSQELVALSQCDYAGDSEDGQASQIMISRASPVPVVFGYFPFDADGAVEHLISSNNGLKIACLAASPIMKTDSPISFNMVESNPETIFGVRINEWGPCNAMCRGACGADCKRYNCRESKDLRCEKDADGHNTGWATQHLIYDCGLHQACIDHDNCYDKCNEEYGCGSFMAFDCMHGMGSTAAYKDINYMCDKKTIEEYGYIKANDWRRGYGIKDKRETYEYLDPEYGKKYDVDECPLGADTSSDDEGEQIPVGTYVGTSNYPEKLVQIFPGEYTQEDVVVIVAEDGTVSGSYSVQVLGDTYVREDNGCASHWENEFSGSFSGQLLGNNGTIISTEKWFCTLIADCSDTGNCDDKPIFLKFEVQVDGDYMTGTALHDELDWGVSMDWVFNAVKK